MPARKTLPDAPVTATRTPPAVLATKTPTRAKRDAGFWKCLTVRIAPAEKFLGAMIDKLARKPKKYSVSIVLKT